MEGGGSALPPGVLALIFEQLDLPNRLRARKVCRLWRVAAAVGCAHVQVDMRTKAKERSYRIGRVRLRGRRLKLSLVESDAAAEEDSTFDRARWMNRTRGHLPQPVVLGTQEELVETVPLVLQQTARSGAALLIDKSVVSLRSQLEAEGAAREEPSYETDGNSELERDGTDSSESASEEDGDGSEDPETRKLFRKMQWYTNTKYEREQATEACRATVLQSLDLATSTFHPCQQIQDRKISYRDTKPRALQRVLTRVDVGGLCWLQSLSVRGCGNLQVLLVPRCLTALDASSASRLRTLNYGHNESVERAGCQVLNLSGCRELQHAGLLAHPHSLVHCRELDLSYCQRLPVATVASALASAGALASLSVRNVAEDLMLHSLAGSPAAARTLCLVDCAFSSKLSDAAVEALVQAAPRLQRMNLRGCTSVSTSCYNRTPITLSARSADTGAVASESANALPVAPGEASCKMRKGDNVFFFTSR